jgi:hypothetical protein
LDEEAWRRIERDDLSDTSSRRQPPRQRATMRAEIERTVKSAVDGIEPLDKAGSNFRMQKFDTAGPRGALAMTPPRRAIENRDRRTSRHARLTLA